MFQDFFFMFSACFSPYSPTSFSNLLFSLLSSGSPMVLMSLLSCSKTVASSMEAAIVSTQISGNLTHYNGIWLCISNSRKYFPTLTFFFWTFLHLQLSSWYFFDVILFQCTKYRKSWIPHLSLQVFSYPSLVQIWPSSLLTGLPLQNNM